MRGMVVAIGVFDGVHLGHRKVIEEGLRLASAMDAELEVMSFVYPMEYYVDHDFLGLIYPPAYRLKLLQEIGVFSVRFIDLIEIKGMSSEEFMYMLKDFGIRGMVVGRNFRFGRGAEGNTEILSSFCKKEGISLKLVDEVKVDECRVSSTIIRKCLIAGDVERANRLLGSPFKLIGRVVRGRRLGSKLGFPTANLNRGHERLVTPKFGVYLVKTSVRGEEMYGLMNVGVRPTIDDDLDVKYEVFLLNYSGGDLYDEKLEISLLAFLREERKYPDLEELKEAIRKDVAEAQKLISNLES